MHFIYIGCRLGGPLIPADLKTFIWPDELSIQLSIWKKVKNKKCISKLIMKLRSNQKRCVLKNFAILTETHVCWSLFSIKLKAFKIILRTICEMVASVDLLIEFVNCLKIPKYAFNFITLLLQTINVALKYHWEFRI